MGLKSNFTFDFTAVLKLDPTTAKYQEHLTRTAELFRIRVGLERWSL